MRGQRTELSRKPSQWYCHEVIIHVPPTRTKWRKCSHRHKLRPCVAWKPGLPLKYSRWWWMKVEWIGLSQMHNTSWTHTKNNSKALPCATQSTIESDVCCRQAKVELHGKKCRSITAERLSTEELSVSGPFTALWQSSYEWQSNSKDDILFKKGDDSMIPSLQL